MNTEKTTLSFTAEELEMIYYALNNYSLQYMEKSTTWGDGDAFIRNGLQHDYYGQEAEAAGRLQLRVYEAKIAL